MFGILEMVRARRRNGCPLPLRVRSSNLFEASGRRKSTAPLAGNLDAEAREAWRSTRPLPRSPRRSILPNDTDHEIVSLGLNPSASMPKRAAPRGRPHPQATACAPMRSILLREHFRLASTIPAFVGLLDSALEYWVRVVEAAATSVSSRLPETPVFAPASR